MGERIKIKAIAETTLIDGVYQTDNRSGKDRRKNRHIKWRFYERRQGSDPRHPQAKQIDEEV
ncbi:hypothetical protein [Vibrio panuliri]|uniref:Uncharacterized protein n=1 Tax=Vibrio panuliri TaxID=1381081 RepID=A0ABX3F593_9VIBR|nr:hypothetical protein [Vibrio panuliri]KAB1453897.1 hypothetical protein F7O85_13400 [Vibrio panuliri]OLQ83962.1 hypothetical protein BIY20_04090 [Vibrio panuliri]